MAHNWVRLQLGEAQPEAEQLGAGQNGSSKTGYGYSLVRLQLVRQMGAGTFLTFFTSNVVWYDNSPEIIRPKFCLIRM